MAPAGNAQAIGEWIAEWFERRGKRLPRRDGTPADVNYLEGGYVDSVGLIDLTMDIESEFRIRLTADTMRDPRFPFVSGLIAIVAETIERDVRP